MIGATLAGYFFRRHVLIMLWFLAGISGLAFIIDFTEFSGRTSALPNYRVAVALSLSLLRLPFIILQVMPFVALFAAMATLFSLNRKYELVVARAAGVSAWQFLVPIGLAAFLSGLIAVLILNPIGAFGIQYANSVEAVWKAGKSNEVTGAAIPWIRQKVGDDETIIGAHAVLGGGAELRDVAFYRIGPDKSISERVDAAVARLNDGYWELSDVTRRPSIGDIEKLPSLRIATTMTVGMVGAKLARPETLAFYDLYQKIGSANAMGYRARSFRVQFQSLLALPVLLVAMTLIAATVSLKFIRFGQSGLMILGGIAAGFLLYVVSVLARAFGSAGVVPTVAAAWFPVVAALFIGITYLLYREDG